MIVRVRDAAPKRTNWTLEDQQKLIDRLFFISHQLSILEGNNLAFKKCNIDTQMSKSTLRQETCLIFNWFFKTQVSLKRVQISHKTFVLFGVTWPLPWP